MTLTVHWNSILDIQCYSQRLNYDVNHSSNESDSLCLSCLMAAGLQTGHKARIAHIPACQSKENSVCCEVKASSSPGSSTNDI